MGVENMFSAVTAVLARDSVQVVFLELRAQLSNMIEHVLDSAPDQYDPDGKTALIDEDTPRSIIVIFQRVIRYPTTAARAGDTEK